MKQTAVNWLIDEAMKLVVQYMQGTLNEDTLDEVIYELGTKAKEMEKEQHQQTFNQARLAKIFEKDMPPVWDSWYQYYNITFKSE